MVSLSYKDYITTNMEYNKNSMRELIMGKSAIWTLRETLKNAEEELSDYEKNIISVTKEWEILNEFINSELDIITKTFKEFMDFHNYTMCVIDEEKDISTKKYVSITLNKDTLDIRKRIQTPGKEKWVEIESIDCTENLSIRDAETIRDAFISYYMSNGVDEETWLRNIIDSLYKIWNRTLETYNTIRALLPNDGINKNDIVDDFMGCEVEEMYNRLDLFVKNKLSDFFFNEVGKSGLIDKLNWLLPRTIMQYLMHYRLNDKEYNKDLKDTLFRGETVEGIDNNRKYKKFYDFMNNDVEDYATVKEALKLFGLLKENNKNKLSK